MIKTGYLLPYGNTLTTPARAEHFTGQKQYEVTDHLGNVLATVGDGRATVGTPTLVDTFKIVRYRPTLASMTDYYPFGMPMPDRQYQDATGYGTTVTQTMLAPQMHTTHIEWNDGLTTATGSATISGTSLLWLHSTVATDGLTYVLHPINAYLTANVVVKVTAVSGSFKIAVKQGTSTISSTTPTVTAPTTASISFTPHVSGDATLEITGTGNIFIDYIELDTFAFVPYTAISSIANQNKYRYGYNGQQKDDEWAGPGNHNSALFWEYDTRVAKRGNLDPKGNKWESPYAVLGNNPIANNDVFGDKWKTDKDKKKAEELAKELKSKEEEYKKIAAEYEQKMKEMQEKGNATREAKFLEKLNEAKAGEAEMKKAQEEFQIMGDPQTAQAFAFKVNKSNKNVSYTSMDWDGTIVMEYGDDANAIHEAFHGYQHLTGELEYREGENGGHYHDLTDEQKAYVRQCYFNPSSITNLRNDLRIMIKRASDVTIPWIQHLYVGKGLDVEYVYDSQKVGNGTQELHRP